jgi:uncharacterized membrane protein YkoI
MTAHLRTPKLVLVASLLTALPAAAAPAEPGSCFEDWSDAAPVVLEEQLLPTRQVHEQARHRLAGDIVSITLCQQDQRFVYRLLLRDPQGRLNTVTIDARHPFDR